MGQISETYASPAMRIGLLLEDVPGVRYSFDLMTASDLNIPDAFAGSGQFCVCTITFPADPETGETGGVYQGWKPVPAKGDPDQWNSTCTKAMGRALKRAGYPDDILDLKAVMSWRKRNAEVGAIVGGHVVHAIGPGAAAVGAGARDELDEALDAAAADSPEGRSGDDGITDAEIVEPADPDDVEEVHVLMDGLSVADRKVFDGFLQTIKAPSDPEKMDRAQVLDVLEWLRPASD